MRKNSLVFPVEFVSGVFEEGNGTLAEVVRAAGGEAARIFIVADMNVVQRTEGLGTRIGRYVQANRLELAGSPVVIAGGEKAKSDRLSSAIQVMAAMLDARIGSGDVVLAIGGGSVLDVAGYAAAQVRGGVSLVRMPTTPAAMIDAAFATMAAVDSTHVKDALQVASVPKAVVVDTAFARTVLDGVWRGGFAEAVRLALVADASLFRRLVAAADEYRARNFEVFDEIVRAAVAVRLKKGDSGFGLWSACRLEALSGYKLPHGYSVAIGVAVDTVYAALKGYLAEDERDQVLALLKACGAMDGASHSRHLITRFDAVLCGLDAWRLGPGGAAIVLPAGIGKSRLEENPDRETMKTALDMVK